MAPGGTGEAGCIGVHVTCGLVCFESRLGIGLRPSCSKYFFSVLAYNHPFDQLSVHANFFLLPTKGPSL